MLDSAGSSGNPIGAPAGHNPPTMGVIPKKASAVYLESLGEIEERVGREEQEVVAKRNIVKTLKLRQDGISWTGLILLL